MEPFDRIDIQELPLSVLTYRCKVMNFLGRNGLRLEDVDLYLAILDQKGDILAGGGLYRDIIKCIAVSPEARSMGLAAPLVSRLISLSAERGFTNLKVFTKPENQAIFESLGFHTLASAPKAILMENGRGLETYCSYLRSLRRPGRSGVVVMNANPFTLGHQYLLEQSAAQVDNLFVIPVREDYSLFSYQERTAMIRSGSCATVLEGSDYQISAATFPTYFLKDLSKASEMQMQLDIDLFGRHIAPALGITRRFVGSEPLDDLTKRYNERMAQLLPSYGVEVSILPRLRQGDEPVSASLVRGALDAGSFPRAKALTPATTHPYLLAALAERALRLELQTPYKPGLVEPCNPGAHTDMDSALMQKGIAAIRPFFPQMALADTTDRLRQLGIDAEKAMLAATGGVNTHRGAIFAIGLALNAFWHKQDIGEIAGKLLGNTREKGAREMALSGYRELFSDWLPYYRSLKAHPYGAQKTLLRIMSTLDDTCILHRVGAERAQAVKKEAKALCENFSPEALEALCRQYEKEHISPGGAADMLALTIFADSIIV